MANTITLEQAVLTQRIGNGDWEAVGLLWSTLTDQPLNSKRPAEKIMADITAMLQDASGESSNEEPKQDVVDYEEVMIDIIVEGTNILRKIVDEQRTKRA